MLPKILSINLRLLTLIKYSNKVLHIYENWVGINDQVAYAFAKNKYVSEKILSHSIKNLMPTTVQIDSKK